MKTVLVLVALGITCSQASAQLKGFSIGPYIEAAKPVGRLDDTNNSGGGVGLNADIRLGKIGLTGSAGFMHFPGKTIETSEGAKKSPAIDVIPVRAGIKYRLVPILYAKLEGGMANYTNNEKSAFILSPGIGLRVLGLDVQAKYETWINNGTRSFWGLKAGYNF